MQGFIFYLTYSICWLISFLPLRVLYVFSYLIYFLTYYIVGYRKKVVYSNLSRAFPEKSKEEIRLIARSFYYHFSDIIIEIVKLIHINETKFLKHVEYPNLELLDELYKQNKHIIGVMGHYGNWEWITALQKFTAYNVMCLYQPLENKYFDNLVYKLRKQFGLEMIPMDKAANTILRNQQQKKPSISIMVADQSPVKSNIQYWTKFLNQDTPVFLGPEKIAKKTNQTIIFINMNKIRRGYYSMEFEKLFTETSDTSKYEITDRHIKALEKNIIKRPELWLWSHRRWKHKKE